MKTLRTIISTALVGTAVSLSPTAVAATGSTSVSVDFPEIIILHYRSGLNIQFTGGSDVATDESTGTISIPLATASGDGGITAGGTATTVIPVDVDNMWAVRGITSTGNIQVAAAITNTTATTTGGSSATMSMLTAESGAASGATITVPSGGLAISSAVYGGIAFNLDIANVTETGTHSGISYTITASAP